MLYFHTSAQRGISTARGRTISTLKWKNHAPRCLRRIRCHFPRQGHPRARKTSPGRDASSRPAKTASSRLCQHLALTVVYRMYDRPRWTDSNVYINFRISSSATPCLDDGLLHAGHCDGGGHCVSRRWRNRTSMARHGVHRRFGRHRDKGLRRMKF